MNEDDEGERLAAVEVEEAVAERPRDVAPPDAERLACTIRAAFNEVR